MIECYIEKLIGYGVETGLVDEYDRIYTRNRLLEVLQYDDYKEDLVAQENPVTQEELSLEEILGGICDWAY